VSLTLASAHARQFEIGWTLNPRYEGQGYATEAARALAIVAFDELGAHRLFARLDADNTGSVRLCERLGAVPVVLRGKELYCAVLEPRDLKAMDALEAFLHIDPPITVFTQGASMKVAESEMWSVDLLGTSGGVGIGFIKM